MPSKTKDLEKHSKPKYEVISCGEKSCLFGITNKRHAFVHFQPPESTNGSIGHIARANSAFSLCPDNI